MLTATTCSESGRDTMTAVGVLKQHVGRVWIRVPHAKKTTTTSCCSLERWRLTFRVRVLALRSTVAAWERASQVRPRRWEGIDWACVAMGCGVPPGPQCPPAVSLAAMWWWHTGSGVGGESNGALFSSERLHACASRLHGGSGSRYVRGVDERHGALRCTTPKARARQIAVSGAELVGVSVRATKRGAAAALAPRVLWHFLFTSMKRAPTTLINRVWVSTRAGTQGVVVVALGRSAMLFHAEPCCADIRGHGWSQHRGLRNVYLSIYLSIG